MVEPLSPETLLAALEAVEALSAATAVPVGTPCRATLALPLVARSSPLALATVVSPPVPRSAVTVGSLLLATLLVELAVRVVRLAMAERAGMRSLVTRAARTAGLL